MTDEEAAIALLISVVSPATMPAAVVIIETRAGAVVAITVIAVVAADIDADTGRVGDGRSADRKRRCRRKCVSELSHVFLLLRFHARPTAVVDARCRNCQETFLNGCSVSLREG